MMRVLLFVLTLLVGLHAEAQVTTPHLILPTYGGVENQRLSSLSAANALHCWRLPTRLGVTGATKMASGMTVGTGVAGTVIGFGIYPDSDTGPAFATISGAANLTGPVSATGLPSFALTEAQIVRLCVCASSNAAGFGGYIGIFEAAAAASNKDALVNVNVTRAAIGASVCTVGVPPSTTGALSTLITVLMPPVILVE